MLNRDLKILGLLGLLTFLLFYLTPLDKVISSNFYIAGGFPIGEQPFWQFLYWVIEPFTVCTALGSIGIMIYATYKRRRLLRAYAALVFLTMLLGPGLIVNTVFKDHWQRPRPVAIKEFGGQYDFVPPLIIGDPNAGKARSFPSGHSSAAFSLFAYGFIFRRRHKTAARRMLFLALGFGAVVGAARMVQGGHFMSDVLFSGYFTYLAATLTYYLILRIPQKEDEVLGDVAQHPIHLPSWKDVTMMVSRRNVS